MLNSKTVRHFALCAALALTGVGMLVYADRAFAQEKQEKPKFDSPFNGQRDPDGPEAKDFGTLLDAYDKMKDDEAELASAKACKGNVEKAQKAFDDAKAAFDKLLDQYVIDWSTYINIQKEKWRVKEEGKKVIDALVKRDKKQHGGAKCPEKGALKIHKPKCREDEPCFMEGFQPAPQPSTTNQTSQPRDNGPVYVSPPPKPGDENDKPNDTSHNPYNPNSPYNPMGVPNYP